MAAEPSPPDDDGDYAWVLASPREPSGVSWLINCLLELGVRVDLQPTVDQIFGPGRRPASAMWLPAEEGRWRLHPDASALQKWLPILAREETLAFPPGPRVLHVQRLPLRQDPPRRGLLFVRDLRDALHSFYRRLRPGLSWEEFVDWPQSETLLDAVDHWRLFVESWLAGPDASVFRFEDYKADAPRLLGRILETMGLTRSAAEIAQAAERSSFTAAAAAETRYRAAHAQDAVVANRAGRVGEWQSLPELQPVVAEIERRAARLLTRLGYETTRPDRSTAPDPWDGLAICRGLKPFAESAIPGNIIEAAPTELTDACRARLTRFLSGLTAEKLKGTSFAAAEIRTLLQSLETFCEVHAPDRSPAIRALAESFADGSTFHLARIRELLVSRRSPRPS